MAVPESTIILVVRSTLFLVYLVVGAAVFQALERDHQINAFQLKQKLRKAITDKYNISAPDIEEWAETYRPTFQVKGDEELEWNFGNSFLFAVVTVTTVGYGNIVPKTVGGRLFCIFYAFIGIPGTCLTLKAIGDKISEVSSIVIAATERRLLKRKRARKIELKTALFNLTLTVVIILPLCAAIVHVREANQWTYFECFYFTFTTLTTIGYGDFVPYFGTSADFLLVVVAFIGLAFVSSILCSLNNLYEAFGLSGKLVRSIKKESTDRTSEKSPFNDASDIMLEDKQNTLEEKKDTLEDNDTVSCIYPLEKRNSKDARAGKRGSVSVGMFKA